MGIKKLILTLTILLLIPIEIIACDCGLKKLAESQKSEMEFSECIFIGKIIEVSDDLTYKIIVVESLDGGDLQGNVYIGRNWRYCYPYVEGQGTWLVYASMENGFLTMNMCGLSRPFDRPVTNTVEALEISSVLFTSEKSKTPEQDYIENMKIHRLVMANEIKALRKRRGYSIKANR